MKRIFYKEYKQCNHKRYTRKYGYIRCKKRCSDNNLFCNLHQNDDINKYSIYDIDEYDENNNILIID